MHGELSNRERIRRCFLGRPLDRAPWIFYFGLWHETKARWENEIKGEIDYTLFDFDAGILSINKWINMGFNPAFEYKVLSETNERIIFQDKFGIIQEKIKGISGIPRIIQNPVQNREDWIRLKKERLNSKDKERFPSNWGTIAHLLNDGDVAVQLGQYPYGLFGTLRDLMGAENLLINFYDQADLVFDIMSDLTDFWLDIYRTACEKLRKVELIHMWEDMSGKQGSLISPSMIRSFMTPLYKKLSRFCGEHDIPGFIVDTDGKCEELIEPFMCGGVNALLPFEVAAGNDVVDLNQKFQGLTLMGGIDKRALYAGDDHLIRELNRITPLLSGSRYIPALDHLVPPEVSWDNFCVYCYTLRQMIQLAGC